MTQPLALMLYEKLLPGSQLVHRLEDLKYRVQTLNDPESLVDRAQESRPMIVLVHLEPSFASACKAIQHLKQNPATRHLPVIAFGADEADDAQAEAKAAGAALIVGESAILNQLSQCLQQVLESE